MEEFMMEVLNVAAIIVAGLMVGCELAIAAFVHPTLDKLPDDVHLRAASALARVLGRFMPFWYIRQCCIAAICRVLIQSGPDASAQSVGRVARLSGNVRQPNHVLANEIAGHKAERRPGAGEEWLAATKNDGAEVKSILINKTKRGYAFCQVWSGNFNLPNELSLQPTYHRLDVILDKRGVGSD